MTMALWVILNDKGFVKEHRHLLDPMDYPRGPLRWLVKEVGETWDNSQSLVKPDILAVKIGSENFALYGTDANEVANLFIMIAGAHAHDPDVAPARRQIARSWLRRQVLNRKSDALTAALEADDIDAAEAAYRRSEQAATAVGGPGLTLSGTAPPPMGPALPTGLPVIDSMWKGGPRLGHLACLCAPSNQGKSMLLPYFVATALQRGKNCLYYTTELSEGMVVERVVSAITGMPIDDIDKDFERSRDRAFQKLAQLADMDDEEDKRYFEVRYRDSGVLTTQMIEADLDELEERGIHIHMVVLDGDDIGVSFNKKYDNAYGMFFHIYGQLSALATKKDILIWTAAQATRDSYDKEFVKPTSIGDSLWKYRKSDYMLGLTQPEAKLDANSSPYIGLRVQKDRFFGSRGRTAKYACKFGGGKDGMGNKTTPGIIAFGKYAATGEDAE